MAKKKTAKKIEEADPPGFLDFLADATAGFWSPVAGVIGKGISEGIVAAVANNGELLKEIGETLKTVLETLAKAGYFGAAPALATFAYESLDLSKVWTDARTPEKVAVHALDVAGQFNTGGGQLLGLVTLASLIPFGSIGDSIDEIWRLPYVQAAMSIAYQSYYSQFQYGLYPYLRRYWLARYLPEIPEPYRIADFWAHGLIDDEKLVKSFEEWGLSDEWAWAWAQSQQRWLGVSDILELYWRGYLTEERAKKWMRWSGYSEEAANAIFELAKRIPPASDLITMVVREAFNPEVYERVAPETPEEFITWMKKQGFSEEWSRRYWVAHYRRMGVEQAWRAFYRGRFTKEQLETFLKYADIHPDDRAVLTDEKVMYDLPTIRELGYGYDVGVYTKEDIEWYRRASGLSPEDAKKAAEAMVAYRSEAEREALRREYMYAYARGAITIEEFEEKLKELKTSVDKIPLWLERAKLYRERMTKQPAQNEPLSITRSTAQWLYEHDVWTEEQFRKALKELGYTDEAIEAYLEQSKHRKAERALEPKRLSEAKLEDLAFYGIITEDEWKAGLMALGYSEEDANKLIRLAKEEWARRAEKPKAISRSTAQWLYEHGVWTEEQLRETLASLGYSAEAIDAYVAQSKRRIEERLAKPKPRYVTASRLERLYAYGIIDRAEFKRGLLNLGYSEEDAERLISLAEERIAERLVTPEAKRLSESDVVDLYEFGLYGVFADAEFYREAGYPPDKAAWYAEHSVEKWYLEAGYSPDDAYLLAKLVYLKYEVPKLRTLYRNGWINKQQLIKGLEELGIPEPRRTEMAMNFIKAEQPERLRKERDLTKSEIIKGVKSGVITPQQAVYLLMDLGYDEWEAWYLLAIYKVVEAGDPEGYWEMRKIIELQKKARGLPAKEIPDELIILEQEQRRLKEELDKLRKTGAPEEEIAEIANKLTLVENKMRTIIGKLGLGR